MKTLILLFAIKLIVINMKTNAKISIVIPAKNEGESLNDILPRIKTVLPEAEVVVVNDGSTDNSSKVCQQYCVTEIKHPYSKGNGAAIKSGARMATGDVFVFLDGDGQHKPEDIPRLLEKYSEGYDLVVGNRDSKSQASLGRLAANRFYNRIASWMVGHRVRDLTSGFRVVNAHKFKEFLYLLPNGFSYPTTSTIAFFRAGYSVCYEPITTANRIGKSHISIVSDGLKFLLIIFKIGILYSPLKMFTPISFALFSIGALYYGYTFSTAGRFTNMSALLLSTSLLVFLMGLVSEQITTLIYQMKNDK